MKIRIVLLFLAIIFGIAAVIGVMFYINSVRSSVEYATEKIDALVAIKDIPKEISVEKLVSDKFVEIRQVPRQYLVTGALTSLEPLKDYITITVINQGEQITQNMFIRPSDISLSFVVPEGMVAVSIPVDEVKGVSNLINVGDMVNVIATLKPDQSQQQESENLIPTSGGTSGSTLQGSQGSVQKEITKTLLWNVQVLHVGIGVINNESSNSSGDLISPDNTKGTTEVKTVTLAVTPEQSEKLVFSEDLGNVWLALVPLKGIEEKETPGRTLENIFQ
jgi:pilus assembly protein CpaB